MRSADLFFWLLAGVLIGALGASFVSFPSAAAGAFLFFAAFFLVFGWHQKRSRLVLLGAMIFGAALGILRGNSAAEPVRTLDQALAGKKVRLEAVVVREPGPRESTSKMVVRAAGANISVTTRLFAPYRPGDRVVIEGKLERPESNIAGFDYAEYLAKEDIFYVMYFPAITRKERADGGTRLLWQKTLFALREAFDESLRRILPEPEASFARGILIGRAASFPQNLDEAMRKTSTVHLVAVSGYNITIVSLAIMYGLNFLTISRRYSWLIAVLAILFYTAFVGAPASAVRAAVMGILVVMARHLGRVSYARNALAFAAGIMVLDNPRVLRWDLGFQLSFLATIGLIWLSPRIAPLLPRFSRKDSAAGQAAGPNLVSDMLGAQLMVMPWIFYKFGTITILGLAANILVMSLTPLMMFWSFLAGAGGIAALWIGNIFAPIAFMLLRYSLWVIAIFAKLPLSALLLPLPSLPTAILMYALIGYIFFRRLRYASYSSE